MGKTEQSRDVAINQGVLQGDCLSPYASLLYILDSLLRRCEGKGIMMGMISIGNLGYADDLGMLVTFADTEVKRVKHSKAAKARENIVLNGLYTCGECGLL